MPNKNLTQDYLCECLHYDPDSGVFTWRHRPRHHFSSERSFRSWNSSYAGRAAGNISKVWGYRMISLCNWPHRAARLAFLYMTGKLPSLFVDHINGIRSDDRWSNLRLVSRAENGQNMARPSDNTSGHTGVSFDRSRGRWRSYIGHNGKRLDLGRFTTIDEAIAARAAAEARLGFHPNHGRAARA